MPTPASSLCLFCGSNSGADPRFALAATELGETFARRGLRLVFGGGSVGLMGLAADACLAHGGKVHGVIPRLLMDKEVGHRGVTQLDVVETMHQRKARMTELSDGFLAMPGGFGTLDELFEALTWKQLGYHSLPVGLWNVAGFFDPLLEFLERARAQGFVRDVHRANLLVEVDLNALIDRLIERRT